VLPRDNPHFDLLKQRASAVGAKVVDFGFSQNAAVHAIQANLDPRGSSVIAGMGTQRFPYRVGAPGEHYVRNSLAVLAAVLALGADAMRALHALLRVSAPAGRGARAVLDAPGGRILLIDESYNANPASVRAALAAMATTPREDYPRRIAVFGDMLELGAASAGLHRGLKDALDAAGIDLLFACGPMMKGLFDEIEAPRQGAWAPDSAALDPLVLEAVRPGDAVMIKGSLASRMAPLAQALLARYSKIGG
jgi:UDP-N-acetylmuramoyl-tripeptide--D-alanyl-D-alanine ligase